ncbi:hypothetical protein SCA6_010737 [Theobroma cacao]
MNSVGVSFRNQRSFSSSSTSPSLLPWISPLQFLKANSQKRDPPPEIPYTLTESQRKPRFVSHETAINLIKRERDPQRALEIFNRVSEQKGFSHNNATYGTILHKLVQSKKFQAIDSILRQMTYETCKFHEGVFLNLMKHFSKFSLHDRVLEMFYAIQPIVREKPSLKAISTCLNLLIESNQVDLARHFLLNSKKSLRLRPNTCIFNILVKHHCKNGDLESAFEVVKEMKKSRNNGCNPNLFNYSTLINGFCKEGRWQEAKEVFVEMESIGLKPDTIGYTTLINCLCRAAQIEEAMELLKEMKEKECQADVVTLNVLLGGLCREGRFQDALQMLKKLPYEGVYLNKASYRIVLNSLCQKDEMDKAAKLVGLMLDRGFVPHYATSNDLLIRLCKAGMVDDAVTALVGLAETGFKPEPHCWEFLTELNCKERKLLSVFELLDELVIKESGQRSFSPINYLDYNF